MKQVSLFVLLTVLTRCHFQLIDPFDMNIPPKVTNEGDNRKVDLFEMNVQSKVVNEGDTGREKLQNKISFYSHLYKRTILLILNSISFKNGQHDTRIYVNILQNDYKFLKKFAENDDDDIDTLSQVDDLLGKILYKPFKEHVFDVMETWTDVAHYLFFNRTTAVLLTVSCVLIIIYKMLRANFTFKYIIRYLLFLGWIYDFAITWLQLLQEKELEQQANYMRYESIPVYCNPKEMSWWQYLWNAISTKDECKEYYKTMYTDNFFQVAPIKVLTKQLGTAIVMPAKDIGEAFGSLTVNIMNSLPFGLNIVLLPIIYMFIGAIFCMTFAFLTKTRIGVNIFHIFKIEFGEKDRDAITDMFSKLMDAHREMVQDIFHETKSNDNEESQTKNTTKKTIKNKNQCEKENKSDSPTSSFSKTAVHDGSGDANADSKSKVE